MVAVSAREVVARALYEDDIGEQSARRWPWDQCPPEGWRRAFYLCKADRVLAALAADPDTVERAARAMFLLDEDYISRWLTWEGAPDFIRDEYREAARAALAAALGHYPPPPQ